MNLVIADAKAGFDVTSAANSYQHTFDLPAGTYLVRAEFNNDLEKSSRAPHRAQFHGIRCQQFSIPARTTTRWRRPTRTFEISARVALRSGCRGLLLERRLT